MMRGVLKRLSRLGPCRTRRRGAAIVEFAVILPLLITLLFGIIEFGHLFHVRLTTQQAAREGCRLAVLQSTSKPYSATGGVVMSRMTEILNASGLSMDQVSVQIAEDSPSDPMVTITITVPYDEVALTGFLGPIATELSGSCSMRKEGA